MKKLLLLLIFLLLLPGCGKEDGLAEPPQEPLPEIADRYIRPAYDLEKLTPARAHAFNTLPGVGLEVVSLDKDRGELVVNILNGHKDCRAISYAPDGFFSIEYYYNGNWYYPPGTGLLTSSVGSFSQSKRDESRNWRYQYTVQYKPLMPGQYRVVKSDITCDCGGPLVEHAVFAEFTVSYLSFD